MPDLDQINFEIQLRLEVSKALWKAALEEVRSSASPTEGKRLRLIAEHDGMEFWEWIETRSRHITCTAVQQLRDEIRQRLTPNGEEGTNA